MLFWKSKESTDKTEKIPYKKEIERIRQAQKVLSDKTKEELIAYTEEVRKEGDKDKQKIQAYAICSELIYRTLGMTPYDVQLAGGYALSEGNIAQMRTGEGKTITALFPAFYGYVANLKTYVITVNEYLVERDYKQAQEVFDYLDIPVGLILKDMDNIEKQVNYKKAVVYVTNSEFAFDYLRDNIAPSKENFMQGDFDFAVIDESDLVLIDEAKNPVIISSSSMDKLPAMLKAKEFVQSLTEEDYEIDEDLFVPYLTDKGYDSALEFFGFELTDDHSLFHAVRQSMMAHFKFKKDVDYIVRDGEVLIVDKFTGRVLAGRRFQQGLHQAIEAKEGVEIQPENVAVATVTYQNLFRKFKLLSGMTGTGIESKKEFEDVYGMDVKVIPTNKPIQRIDNNDIMFKTKEDKYEYLVKLVKEKHEKGQPVLIGTISIQESEEVSDLLEKAKIPFNLLNAKNDKEEADIVQRAGEKGAVTIATNMAGRGTDIKVEKEVEEELGGLYLLGVSRNESKRIDRQLIGRAGRQGQKGESQFLTSLEDEFLVKYPTLRFEKFAKKNKEYPCHKEIVTKMVDEIQDVADSQGTQIRKFQFQMDEILHYQREYVYGMRNGILVDGLEFSKIKDNVYKLSEVLVERFSNGSNSLVEWNMEELNEVLKNELSLVIPKDDNVSIKKDFVKVFEDKVLEILNRFEEKIEKEEVQRIINSISVNTIDQYYKQYLDYLEAYKSGFGMQSMGEQDPIRLFSMDVDAIFKQISAEAWEDLFKQLFKRIDIMLTIGTHPFFTLFPMKDNYLFKFNLPKEKSLEDETSNDENRTATQKVRSVLYSERNIIEEFNLVGTTHVIVNIQRALTPGKYVVKNFIGDKEINKIGFRVIEEQVEQITANAPALYFRLPLEEMHKVQDTTLKVTLTHVYSKNAFAFDLPIDNEWVNIEKPDEQNWMLGRYVLTITGSNLPLYHREYIVNPAQVVEEKVVAVEEETTVPDNSKDDSEPLVEKENAEETAVEK